SDGLLPPKLTGWSGWAAREPAGGAVVVGAPGNVVDVFSAAARVPASAHAGAATVTGAPHVLPPSVDTMTLGSRGSGFGAVGGRVSDRNATYPMSSGPLWLSTARSDTGRDVSVSGATLPRALRAAVVVQWSPKSVDLATSTLTLPLLTPPSPSSYPLSA